MADKSKAYISSGIFLSKDQWNEKKKEVTPMHPNYIELNDYFKREIAKYISYDLNMMREGKTFNKKFLLSLSEEKVSSSFIEYARKQIAQANIVADSASSQSRSITILEQYAKNVTFDGLTLDLILAFTQYMKVKLKLSQGTMWRVHKDVKKYVHLALKQNLISYQNNPYNNFVNIRPKSKAEYLNFEELKKLECLDVPEGDLRLTRDVFLFGCYTGLRFSDLQLLNDKSLTERDSVLVLTLDRMVKVDKRVFLRLSEIFEGKPEKLIRPYLEENKGKEFVWGKKIQNQTLNAALKIIQAEAGIDTLMTMHLSRHTFGTLYAKQTGSIFEVMKAMGIAKFSTAQIYINLSDEL